MQLQWINEEARLAAIQAVTASWTPDDVFDFLGNSEVGVEAHRVFEDSLHGACEVCGTPTPLRKLAVVNDDDVQRCPTCLKIAAN